MAYRERTAMTKPKTQTLDVPDATVTYDVREAESESAEPVLLMIGSPMDASGFEARAAMEDIHETYKRDGFGPAMAKFLALTRIRGPIPSDFPDQAPNPADFGLPTEDDGSRDHPLLGPHMLYTSRYEPNFESLRDASTRIVVAGGIESEATFPYRAALAVAERLGTDVVVFPSHHGGFH